MKHQTFTFDVSCYSWIAQSQLRLKEALSKKNSQRDKLKQIYTLLIEYLWWEKFGISPLPLSKPNISPAAQKLLKGYTVEVYLHAT